MGKTEKYWEGNAEGKKKTSLNKIINTQIKEKNESNIFNSTSNNSRSENGNDESLKDAYFISLEDQKLNNLIKTIENKFGWFFFYFFNYYNSF